MKLFDIARCKCPCFITCSCLPTDRVPIQGHSFLLDQRDKRLMFIGPIDHRYTIRCQKSCARASIKTSSQQFTTSLTANTPAMFSPKTDTTINKSTFFNLTIEGDQYKFSDRVAVRMANATLLALFLKNIFLSEQYSVANDLSAVSW